MECRLLERSDYILFERSDYILFGSVITGFTGSICIPEKILISFTTMFEMLEEISPAFRPYIKHLCGDLKLGLCKAKIDIEKLGPVTEGICSQFRLVLPYCSKKLKWEIIFDHTAPWFAPDFRFDDDSFLGSLDTETIERKIPSLANWNENDPRALTQVVSELVNLYKQYQLKKLNDDKSSRACFEYSALLSSTSNTDIEVWVGNHIVEFLIKLNVDTTRIPELYRDRTDENPGLDSALLLVRYPNSTNAELILSPNISSIIGHISLPHMLHSGVLIDYVPMVTDLINSKIQSILINEKKKRELVAQMIIKYEGAMLEHDEQSAAFLFETNDFHWILHIEIGSNFPEKQPIVTLRSIYHSTKGKPKSKILLNCPFNNFESFIEEQVEIFKNECLATPGTVSNNTSNNNNVLINLDN